MVAAQADVETRNEEVVRSAFHAWRGGTGNVFDLLEPNAPWTIVGNSPVQFTEFWTRVTPE